MKTFFFFTAIAFLTLSSCKKEAASSSEDKTAAQSQLQTKAISSGGAQPFYGSFDVHYDGQQFYNPCTNELATVYGFEKVIFNGINNGTKSTITFHVNMPGTIRAVGESGTEYVINDHLLQQESYFSNGVFTTKHVSTLRWVASGGGNNFTIKETYYIKVDADGNVTVIRDPVNETYCR
jgi:hypothetical protein